jgi:hypothetical protein
MKLQFQIADVKCPPESDFISEMSDIRERRLQFEIVNRSVTSNMLKKGFVYSIEGGCQIRDDEWKFESAVNRAVSLMTIYD